MVNGDCFPLLILYYSFIKELRSSFIKEFNKSAASRYLRNFSLLISKIYKRNQFDSVSRV